MKERLTIVSACARARVLRAGLSTAGERSTTASGQASEPVASGQGTTAGQAEEAGVQPEATEAAKQTVIGTVKKLEVTLAPAAASEPIAAAGISVVSLLKAGSAPDFRLRNPAFEWRGVGG